MTETNRGRIALVIGAARGLGRAMCIGLAQAGYNVAALDLRESEAELETFTQEVGPQSAVVFPVCCDVTKFEECRVAWG